MTRQLPIIALVVAVLVVGGCGGGGDDTSTSSSSTSSSTSVGKEGSAGGNDSADSKRSHGSESRAEDRSSQGSHGVSGSSHSSANAGPLKVSGGGSAQFRLNGGDNSIQEFGAESDEAELRAAAEAAHDFLIARVGGEWARACSYLAAQELTSLEQFGSQSPRLKGKGCVAVLGALLGSVTSSEQREVTTVDAGSLRSDGEQAFLIYHGVGGTIYSIPMTEEDGEWKVTALTPVPLS